jgi:plasmid stabilization system protein ParE
LSDLEAIADYIARRDDEVAAERWVDKLIAQAQSVASAPYARRRVPELGRDDIRETFLHTYRIVFQVSGERIDVLTLFEGHRSVPDDLDAG